MTPMTCTPCGETGRQTDRQTDRHADRQADRQADGQKYSQTELPVCVEVEAELHGGPGGELHDSDVHALRGDGQLAGEGLDVAQQALEVGAAHTGRAVQHEDHVRLAQTAWRQRV